MCHKKIIMKKVYNKMNNRKEYIEKLSLNILETFKIQIPIIDIEDVVKTLGGTLEINNFEGIDGRLQKNGDSFVITINEEQTYNRINFTVAHEIGHLFLHMGYIIDEQKWEDSKNAYYRRGNSKEEHEANEFAAAFLMPKNRYKEVMDQYTIGNMVNTGKVAEYFNVSASAASNRGKWLGYLEW